MFESSTPLSEKAPSTPPADYMDGSDEDKSAMLTIAPKKLPKNNVKRTLGSKCKKKESLDTNKITPHAIAPKKRPQAVRERLGQPSASRRQSPPPGNNDRLRLSGSANILSKLVSIPRHATSRCKCCTKHFSNPWVTPLRRVLKTTGFAHWLFLPNPIRICTALLQRCPCSLAMLSTADC